MTRINLLKRKGITFDEFKAWVNQLIVDKKGALPDLNDWKEIKKMMDKVRTGSYDDSDDADAAPFYPLIEWTGEEDCAYTLPMDGDNRVVSLSDLEHKVFCTDKHCIGHDDNECTGYDLSSYHYDWFVPAGVIRRDLGLDCGSIDWNDENQVNITIKYDENIIKDLNVTTETVEAKSRKLPIEWSLEPMQDLKELDELQGLEELLGELYDIQEKDNDRNSDCEGV